MNNVIQRHDGAHFEAMYADNDDPWHMRASWYEQRKRAVLLASLPVACYESAYEPGCGNGELTLALARRCRQLLASDGSACAASHAAERLLHARHVNVVQAWLPEQWPEGQFDLVVLSEFLYYLDSAALDETLERVRACLSEGGTVVACHWRAPIAGCALNGDAVHERVHAGLALPRLARYLDTDFHLDVWQGVGASPAQREGRR